MTDPRPVGLPARRSSDWPAAAEADDEISLFDLWAVLVRRRWLMLAVLALVVAAAVAFAFARPDVYRYSGTVDGGAVLAGGSLTALEPVAALKAEAEQVHIPAALRASDLPEQLKGDVQLSAEVPADSGLLVISGTAAADRADLYRDLIRDVAGRLGASHDSRYRLTLEAARESLAEIQSTLEIQRQRASAATERLGALQRREQALDQEIESLRTRVEGDPDSAALQNRLNRALELRDVVLPERIQQAQGERAQAELAAARAQRELQTLRAQIEAMRPIALLEDPVRALRPEGPGGAVVLALGLVLGAMLAVFAAFATEFVSRANDAMGPR